MKGKEMSEIEKLSTSELEAMLDKAEETENDALYERIEAELDRRDYDASDPASPTFKG